MAAVIPNSPRSRPVGQLVTGAALRGVRALSAATSALKASRTRLVNDALQLGGLGCVDVAAFEVASPLGWLTTGVSAFVLSWLMQPDGQR